MQRIGTLWRSGTRGKIMLLVGALLGLCIICAVIGSPTPRQTPPPTASQPGPTPARRTPFPNISARIARSRCPIFRSRAARHARIIRSNSGRVSSRLLGRFSADPFTRSNSIAARSACPINPNFTAIFSVPSTAARIRLTVSGANRRATSAARSASTVLNRSSCHGQLHTSAYPNIPAIRFNTLTVDRQLPGDNVARYIAAG